MTPNLRLRLFGTPQIEIDGKPAIFKRRKSEVLVAYLALHKGAHSREKIASLFWGDSSAEDARRTLRVVLTDTRKTLGEDALSGNRDTLSLNTACMTELDVRTFSALLPDLSSASTPDLLSTLDLYRGDLLEGVYDEWVLPLRETYRNKILSVLNTLTERARADGDYSHAAEFAERSLQLDPFNETAIQHLIVSLAAGGDKEWAIKRFKEFEKKDDIEFSKETLALYHQIQDQSATAAARLTNLPRPLTSFIGREEELNEVETLLTRHRLVTLLGAGGSGKTRLSIQAADEVAHEYSGGVWWVDLSSLAKADLVEQVIARALGAREQSGKSFIHAAAEIIGEKKTLVLLDNCEHVLEASSQSVAALLTQCPQLTVLATSREPLGVDGEVGWQVPAFPLPEAGVHLKALSRNEAVRLFVERGRSSNTSFQLSESNAKYVINICLRLDGIPLALELAATLLRSMPVEDVSKRLDRQFESLHFRDDIRPLRQQTLHALIDWSYNLLTPAEQIFFRRLGIFAGGWSFESAMIVAGGYDSESLQTNQASSDKLLPLPISATDIVYGLLDSLKRRSLISLTHANSVSRYRMLETLREYALERCVEHSELTALRSRHLKATLRLTRDMDEKLYSGIANQVEVLNQFDYEVDNIRLALGWALDEGDINDGLMLGAAMYRFWTVRQLFTEIRKWLEKLREHPRAQMPTLGRAYVLTKCALSLRNTPLRKNAEPLIAEAMDIFKSLNDEEGIAYTYFCDGETRMNYGDLETARQSLLMSLEYYRVHSKNLQTFTSILSTLARIALNFRQFAQAYEYVNKSLMISEAHNAPLATGWNRLVLGDIAFRMDKLGLAAQHYEVSLQTYLPIRRWGNIAYLQEVLGAIAFARGDIHAASSLVEQSLKSYGEYGGYSTFSRAYRSAVALAQGDMETARIWLLRAVEDMSDVEPEYRAVYLGKLGDYAAARNLTSAAGTLYALTLRLELDPVTVLFPPELRAAQAGLVSTWAHLLSAEYEAAIARAESISFEEAVGLIFPAIH